MKTTNRYNILESNNEQMILLRADIYKRLKTYFPKENIFPVLRILKKFQAIFILILFISCACPPCQQTITCDTIGFNNWMDSVYASEFNRLQNMLDSARGIMIHDNIIVSNDTNECTTKLLTKKP